MIVTENYEIKGIPFVRTYSNANRYVVRDGYEYAEANDPAEFGRTYVEGREIEAEPQDQSEIEDKAEAYDILTGASE